MYSLSVGALGGPMGPRADPARTDPDDGPLPRENKRRLAALGVPAHVEAMRAGEDGGSPGLRIVPTGGGPRSAEAFTVRLSGDRSPGWVERAVGAVLARLPVRASLVSAPPTNGAPTEVVWCDPP